MRFGWVVLPVAAVGTIVLAANAGRPGPAPEKGRQERPVAVRTPGPAPEEAPVSPAPGDAPRDAARAATLRPGKTFWRELEGTRKRPRAQAVEEVYGKTAALLGLSDGEVAELRRRVESLRAVDQECKREAGDLSQAHSVQAEPYDPWRCTGDRTPQGQAWQALVLAQRKQAAELGKSHAARQEGARKQVHEFFKELPASPERDFLAKHAAIWLHFVVN